jgi:hypothetical protein
MTHGINWLSDPFVGMSEPQAPPGTAPAEPTFAAVVLPVLEQRCSNCHGESKQKGELALHTEAAIRKGGENGAVLVAGKPDDSELLRRLLLPLDDEDHMPPEDKAQPSAAEIEVLRDWIAAGAPFQGPFATGAVAAVATAQPKEQPKELPKDTTPKEGANDAAPKAPPAPPTAIAALHERLVHAVPVAAGEPGLWIDFAAVAPTMTEAEARTLLTPVLPWVQDLGLARVPIGNELLTLCARMPMLARLDLRATRVTTAGLLLLKDHAHLQHLVLAETRLDDQATDALLAMPALRSVHLWEAGLSESAIQRLRGKEGLQVEAGEQTGGSALETEPPPRLEKASGAAPPAEGDALRPVNTACPVSGKPVDARYVVVHEQRAVGFCCPECPARFWEDPKRYPVGN